MDASVIPSRLQWGHALGGVETLAPHCTASGVHASFNGATPWEAWKLNADGTLAVSDHMLQWGHALGGVETREVARAPRSRRRSFNGATPWEAWKLDPQPPPSSSLSLSFNGATPWEAWKHHLCEDQGDPHPASMGPRLGRRGNSTRPGSHFKNDPPLQWGHALGGVETCSSAPPRSCPSCFNGATPWEAWKLMGVQLCKTTILMLQWGHALGGVETAHFSQPTNSPSALQWGHALGGVETKRFGIIASGCDAWLQWGHALGGVETPVASPPPTPTPKPKLQWGHALGGVETSKSCQLGWPLKSTLQWGHALGGVETSMARSHRRSAPRRFNGATPWEAWKPARAAADAAWARAALQWGHALGGVETSTGEAEPAGSRQLQWGHALGGVET